MKVDHQPVKLQIQTTFDIYWWNFEKKASIAWAADLRYNSICSTGLSLSHKVQNKRDDIHKGASSCHS
jgi:hypothetical protein